MLYAQVNKVRISRRGWLSRSEIQPPKILGREHVVVVKVANLVEEDRDIFNKIRINKYNI